MLSRLLTTLNLINHALVISWYLNGDQVTSHHLQRIPYSHSEVPKVISDIVPEKQIIIAIPCLSLVVKLATSLCCWFYFWQHACSAAEMVKGNLATLEVDNSESLWTYATWFCLLCGWNIHKLHNRPPEPTQLNQLIGSRVPFSPALGESNLTHTDHSTVPQRWCF